MGPELRHQLFRVYLAKGVQGSAAIEGNSLTTGDVEAAIDGKLEVPASRAYQKQEIENILGQCTKIANEIINHENSQLTAGRIQDFHRQLFDGLDIDDHNPLGQTAPVDIIVGRYRGAPRGDCDLLLDKLADWIGKEWSTDKQGERWISSLCMAFIKSIVAHLYFVWIHPFGDGNGRTARLIEVFILLRAGVPMPAAQLLSNHYNQTRDMYYRKLDRSSKTEEGLLEFIEYAVQGLRDGLRQQIDFIRHHEFSTFFRDYVYEHAYRDAEGKPARRQRRLILDLLDRNEPVEFDDLSVLSRETARAYADVGERTLDRDLDALTSKRLLVQTEDGEFDINRDIVLDRLPPYSADDETTGDD